MDNELESNTDININNNIQNKIANISNFNEEHKKQMLESRVKDNLIGNHIQFL